MNINNLPKKISVFPLSDVVFFPKFLLQQNKKKGWKHNLTQLGCIMSKGKGHRQN